MIVLDTSAFVDAIIPFDRERHRKSTTVLDVISKKELEVFEPKLLVVELSAVLARYRPRDVVVNHVNEIVKHVNLVEYEELHETALNIALNTGCRAIDAFFIGCAKETNSILVSSDKVQVSNARKAGIESYYLLEEYSELLAKLQKL